MEDNEICFCNGQNDGLLIFCNSCRKWYHCEWYIGVDESRAQSMENFVCEFCAFEDPNDKMDEDEYVYDPEEEKSYKRSFSESHRSSSKNNGISRFGNVVEEMNEQSILRSISSVEQKLLAIDKSPSIHDTVVQKQKPKTEKEERFQAVISSYREYNAFRNDLVRKKLLNRLIRVKDLSVVNMNEQNQSQNPGKGPDDLSEEMHFCVDELSQYEPPPHSIPINADIRTLNWKELGQKQFELTGRYYDVIMMDPPWQLSTANPTRGVAIAYEQLEDDLISSIPLSQIQKDGYLFLWVINAKYRMALEMLENWGYTFMLWGEFIISFVDEIAWVKCNRHWRMAKSHGFYLQHSKETCFVAKRGNPLPLTNFGFESDVIYSERLGQSQKPIDVYELIERLVPNGYYLEVFGRRNNLRNNWVTVGNEL